MRFEVLGQLRVLDAGRDVTPQGVIGRTLLCGLLMHTNQPVRPDTLTEMLWPGSPDSAPQLHVAVHRLRKLLDDPDRLQRDQRGYRLGVEEHESDLASFDRLAAELLGQPRFDTDLAREALALWRGEPFEGVDHTSVTAATRPWADRRQVVEAMLFEAEIDAGRSQAVLVDLEEASGRRPLDERLQGLLVRGLHAAGRTADALSAYTRTAETLREELGLDPGPELQSLQASILAGEGGPSLGGRTAAPVPAQLPAGTDLIGRDQDLAEIDKHFADGGLCVLAGAPGVGKTALAVHWGQLNRERFPDGQLFVDLRGFSDDEPALARDVAAAFLRALGMQPADIPTDGDERSALLRSHLADQRLLLVLDNARSADQVRPLLPGAGSNDCRVLVTSRESLSGLAAREGAQVVSVGRLDADTGLALLAAFAGDRVHQEHETSTELVRLCASLPLALRLAAEQIRARAERSIADLVADLSDERDRLDLLDTGDDPTTDVRAVFSWSYESLSPETAHVFRHLGLLPGQDTDLHALAALCGTPVRETRRSVERLVRAHLVEESPGGRLSQHDLLKSYAAERAELLETEEAIGQARARQLCYYLHATLQAHSMVAPGQLATEDAADVELPPMTTTRDAVDWVQVERHNAVATAMSAPDPALDQLITLTRALSMELFDVPHVATAFLESTRAAAEVDGDDRGVGFTESALGVLHGHLGDLDAAERHMLSGRDAFDRCGYEVGHFVIESNLARVTAARGDFRAATRLARRCLAFEREHGERNTEPLLLTTLGEDLLRLGRVAEARRHLEEARDIAASLPGHFFLALATGGLSRCRAAEGRLTEALALAEEALEESRARLPGQVAFSLTTRGHVHLRLGDPSAAKSDHASALHHARTMNDSQDVYEALDGYASAVAWEDPAAAVPYFREAIDAAVDSGFAFFGATSYVGLAEACAAAGDPDAEAEAFRRARDVFGGLDISSSPD